MIKSSRDTSPSETDKSGGIKVAARGPNPGRVTVTMKRGWHCYINVPKVALALAY